MVLNAITLAEIGPMGGHFIDGFDCGVWATGSKMMMDVIVVMVIVSGGGLAG